MNTRYVIGLLFFYVVLTPNYSHAGSCTSWENDTFLSEHLEMCNTFASDMELYEFLKNEATEANRAGEYEKQKPFALEILKLIDASGASIFDTRSTERVVINKNLRLSGARNSTNSDVLHLAFKVAFRTGRRDNYLPLLKKGEDLQYPWAYFEFARRFYKTQHENSIAKLDTANSLGYETPEDIVHRLVEYDKEQKKKNAELNRVKQEEMKRKAEEQRKREEYAAMEIPLIDKTIINESLHKLLIKNSRISDAALAASTGLPKGFSYNCESDYCYSMAGLIKFRFVVLNVDRCKYPVRTIAECYIEWKLEEEVTLNMGNHPGNELLQGILDQGVTRSYAELKFTNSNWTMMFLR